jgi:hypothetical protein
MEALSLHQSLKLRQAELGTCIYGDDFKKIFKIPAIFAGVVLLAGVSVFGLNGLMSNKSKVSSAPVASAMAVSSLATSTIPTMLEVHIANNGLVFVRGAQVTSISDGVIRTSMFWGSTDFVWVVKTSGVTKFINQQGQKQNISDVKVGDIVTITGKLASDNDKFIINAEFVRE